MRKLIGPGGVGVHFVPTGFFACAALLGFEMRSDPIAGWYVVFASPTALGAFVVATWLLGVSFFAETEISPFIYFQF